MAIVKHIKSRNANYSDALNYLLYQHDEETGKPILDEYGNKLLREEFYMDGLNCSPLSFDKDCRMTNRKFNKNQKKEDIKSHHYIISFDPADATECGLTGRWAQELCLEFARKNFPGYQALVVTHTDGGNQSGNIHTHIVINSVRKYAVKRQSYMDKPNEEKAGYKHRSTNRFLNHLKKEVMEMCEREGLHQIDLLSPAPEKVTEAEFRAKAHGQKKLDRINKKIVQEGLRPAATTFQTQKDFLRNAIKECSRSAGTFEEFQSLLLENYNISVISQRGRYRYLHPDRDRRITEKALGTKYGREHLEKINYIFSSLEMAYIIWQCPDATLAERFDAWQEIIDTMPDTPLPDSMELQEMEGVHEFLRQYIKLQQEFLDEFNGEEDGVYFYRYIVRELPNKTWPWQYITMENFDHAFLSLSECKRAI